MKNAVGKDHGGLLSLISFSAYGRLSSLITACYPLLHFPAKLRKTSGTSKSPGSFPESGEIAPRIKKTKKNNRHRRILINFHKFARHAVSGFMPAALGTGQPNETE
ncbi:MAG: hypothetical protein ACTTHE_01840 [Prevotella multiformis]|uniref:hypothetical protein n=1 Tax=Prevotella multiformis TaxID=282402 RepID=UPI003FA0C4A5